MSHSVLQVQEKLEVTRNYETDSLITVDTTYSIRIMKLTLAFLLVFLTYCVKGASKAKPHGHNGVLPHYDGKHIPYDITPEQVKKLNNGEHVSLNIYFKVFPSNLVKSQCLSRF